MGYDVEAFIADWDPLVRGVREQGGVDFLATYSAPNDLFERIESVVARHPQAPVVRLSISGGRAHVAFANGDSYRTWRPFLSSDARHATDAFLTSLYPNALIATRSVRSSDLEEDGQFSESAPRSILYALRPSSVRRVWKLAHGVSWDELDDAQARGPPDDSFELCASFHRRLLDEAHSAGRGLVLIAKY